MGLFSPKNQNEYSNMVNRAWDNIAKVKCGCDKKCPNGRKINIGMIFVNDVNTPHHYDIKVGSFRGSNMSEWPKYDGYSVAAHEMGHYLGNKDEYGTLDDGVYHESDPMAGVMSHRLGKAKCRNFNHVFETVKKTRTLSKLDSCGLECEK